MDTDKYKILELWVVLNFVSLLNGLLAFFLYIVFIKWNIHVKILLSISVPFLYISTGRWIANFSEKIRIWAYCGNATGWTDVDLSDTLGLPIKISYYVECVLTAN